MLGLGDLALASHAGANAAAKQTAVTTSIENLMVLIFLPPLETWDAAENAFSVPLD
jgi:hypothetical protein